MNKNRGFLILSGVILTFSATYIFACNSSHFNVSEIKARGNDKVSSDEIMEKAKSCVGANIFSLDLKRIEKRLRQDKRIKEVVVKRRLPGCILVEVEEKLPVLWISLPPNYNGSRSYGFWGLSIDQEIIPLEKKDLHHDLPLVSGIEMGKPSPGQAPQPYRKWSEVKAEKALEFYRTVTAIDPSSVKLLSEINLKDMSNMTVYLIPGIRVMMGHGSFEKKWRRLRAILGKEDKIEELVSVDLRFDDQVVLSRSSKTSSSPAD